MRQYLTVSKLKHAQEVVGELVVAALQPPDFPRRMPSEMLPRCIHMPNISKPVKIDIFSPDYSIGLMNDSMVVCAVIEELFGDRVQVRAINVTSDAYHSGNYNIPFPEELDEPGEIAIFIEHAFVSDFINDYRERAIFINPEWFSDSDKLACERVVDTVLHKTRHYHAALSSVMSSHRHIYTGFTSIDPCAKVENYDICSHFRGKSQCRLTQNLIEIWQENPNIPLLRVHAYGNDIAVNTNAWARAGNIEFYLGALDRKDYFRELAQGGIHLCTTQVEGFGHFLNEARAMSALVIALDAPPMNELVTPETGILVPALASHAQCLGTVYTVRMNDLARSIEQALKMPLEERETIGNAARALYEQQAREFKQRLYGYLQKCIEQIPDYQYSVS